MMARVKELEVVNHRLKKMYAEECLNGEMTRDAIEKIGITAVTIIAA